MKKEGIVCKKALITFSNQYLLYIDIPIYKKKKIMRDDDNGILLGI